MAYSRTEPNAKAFRPKDRGKDRRVSLTPDGRKEHTRLFHGVENGKPAKSRLWRSNRTMWRKANSKPGNVVTINVATGEKV
jgi:hypothetical protein